MYGYEVFHEELIKNLIESVHDGKSSHAYIFEGEKGLGTLEAARLFAAALTCSNTSISPCGTCQTCIESKADTNPDIIYVRPQKDKKSIGADDMRALSDDVAIKPFNSERKVYIIEDGALLTEPAQNTFLKTFEEPPEYAVFIMLIENLSTLLDTVLSRFTLVHFPVLSEERIKKYITEKYPEEKERLPFLLKYCSGIPETVDAVINDSEFESLRDISLEKIFALASRDKRDAFVIQKFLEEKKENINQILDFWLSFVRDAVLIQLSARDKIMNVDKKDILKDFSSKTNPEIVLMLYDRLVTAQKMIKRYVNIKGLSLWLSLKK